MSGPRALTILLTTVATIALVLAFLFVPLSLATGHLDHVGVELVLVVLMVGYLTRVMRRDRASRRAAEAALPPEQRSVRRAARQPVTFQVRETIVAFAVWFGLVLAAGAFVLDLPLAVNAGAALFAAFMLATLTVTGRHMIFRITAEEGGPPRVSGGLRPPEDPPRVSGGLRPPEDPPAGASVDTYRGAPPPEDPPGSRG
ncbi:MAG: hypothetical protein M3O91_08745 [Chloroflexota bacterium]|nr:hypothetical protein [Chloroflexota bacterium]